MMTIRFDAPPAAEAPVAALVRQAAGAPRMAGAHLCIADAAASGVMTEEKRGRTDIGAPPAWFALLEATDAEALTGLLDDAALTAAGAMGPYRRGLYRLEFLRTRTAWAP
jgi:hypothetical protein